MFDDLHDPAPPRPGLDTLASVAVRARRRARRRRTVVAGVVTALAALAAGGMIVARRGDDSRDLVASVEPTAPTTVPPAATSAPSAPSLSPVAPMESTVPPFEPSTTAVPPRRTPVLAIGDSVMLGAGPELMAAGITVDAVANRQLQDAVVDLESAWSTGASAESVVVHVGTNGPFAPTQLDELLVALDDVANVVLLTIHGDRPWIEENNRLLRAVDAPNVTLLDWATLVEACPGDCLFSDGIHLRPDGAAYYTALIAEALGRDGVTSTRIVTAITATGDAVYLDAATGEAVVLFEGFGVDDVAPTEGDVTVVDGVVVLPDGSAAFVGLCCEPIAGTLLRTVPPTPATYDSFAWFAHAPALDPSGTRIAALSYEFVVVLDRDGEELAMSEQSEVFRTPVDVAWIDDTALVVLSTDGDQFELAVYVVVEDRLVERNRRPIGDEIDTGDIPWPSLAGGQGIIRVLTTADSRSEVARFDPSTLQRLPGADTLPQPARSAWFDGGDVIWVSDAGQLHVGDTVVPGDYTWARR